jgi:hypothetical protein
MQQSMKRGSLQNVMSGNPHTGLEFSKERKSTDRVLRELPSKVYAAKYRASVKRLLRGLLMSAHDRIQREIDPLADDITRKKPIGMPRWRTA